MQKLAKVFRFEGRNYRQVTISDTTKIRLNIDTNQLELKVIGYQRATGDPLYSTDTDLTVTTWITEPTAVRQWLGFEAEPPSPNQPDGTSVRFKLTDGTDDYYWDGGTWTTAGATDWNTEQEIAGNISSFVVSSAKMGVVINLVTTDQKATPTLQSVALLMNCEIDYLRSLLAEAIVPSLRAGLRVGIDHALHAPGGDKVSLQDLETKYTIVTVDAVYNHTNDAMHLTDLLSSYDADGKVATLSAGQTRGETLWVKFTAEPKIYVNWANQDYTEVERVPAAVLDSFSVTGSVVAGQQCVRDLSAMQANVRRWPFRLAIEFGVLLLAEKNRTLFAMQERALAHALGNQLLHWPELDEYVQLLSIGEGGVRPRPNLSDKHEARYTLRIEDLYLWLLPDEDLPLVQEVNITISSPGLRGGPKWTGAITG